jgi:AbrB family looped-hinge helix DNA binding protein
MSLGVVMVKKSRKIACGPPSGRDMGCCNIEGVVVVADRGQLVLPKDIRDKAGIKAGDKLAVVGMERDDQVCCISLIKVEDLKEMVRNMLGPVMKDIFQPSEKTMPGLRNRAIPVALPRAVAVVVQVWQIPSAGT